MTATAIEPTLWSDDYAAAAAFGADPADVEDAVQRFGHGECATFAGRLHEWTGWDVYQLPGWQHWCVCRPDGALLDIYGVFHRGAGGWDHVARRYGMTETDWSRMESPARVCWMENAHRAEIDAFLDTPWGRAILPLDQRRATPIFYPDLDLDLDEDDE